MLDVMRKHSRSFIIYVLFGIIIAVFVVNFGPGSQGGGCASSTSAGYAGTVEGNSLTAKALAYVFTVSGIRTQQVPEPQLVMLKGRVVDQLLFRELLAEDALDLGFRIPDQEINDMLIKGRYLALGQARPLARGDDDKFDYDLFSRYVRFSWGLTVKKFKEEQRRELLAEKFRDLIRSSVKVSESEVRSDFIQKNTQVQLDYVRFTPGKFRSQVKTDEAAIKAFIAENRAKVKQHYEDNKKAYQNLPKEARLQLIQIKSDEKDAAARATGQRKAEAALKRIKAGEGFDRVAQETSDDEESRAAGGVLGWRNEDSPGTWPQATKQVAQLKPGEISGLVPDKEGFTIVKLLGRRQGNLTLEQAQGDIAEEMLRDKESVRLARQTAQSFLKRVQAGEKLAELFTSEDVDADPANDKEDKPEAKPEAEPSSRPSKAPYRLMTSASFPRSGQNLVPGVGISSEMMRDVFELKTGNVAPRVYTVDGNVFLVAVKERTNPDWADWTKRLKELTEEYQSQKYVQELMAYAYQRCEAAYKNKDIAINQGALVTPGYAPPKNEPPLPQYLPCTSLKPDTL